MEVGYNNILVKKFSYGNSFAIENDVENKKFKVRFINKWSVTLGTISLLSIITVFSVIWGYSSNRSPIVYEYDKRITREKKYTKFHEDQFVTCGKNPEACPTSGDLVDQYSKRLEEGLKGKNLEIIPGESIWCEKESLDKYGFSKEGQHKAATKEEMKLVAEMLEDKRIILEEKFELDTFILFKEYMRSFEKDYATSEEYKEKYSNFRKNRIMIETHNSDPHKLYTMGYTEPSDSSEENLRVAVLDTSKQVYLQTEEQLSGASKQEGDKFNTPGIIFDWRSRNCVVPVRDQGKCGSCWAFSSADLIASAIAIKTKKLTTYSVQQFLDCVLPGFGCKTGGSPFIALIYAANYPYCTEEEYPYDMADFACIQPNKCKNRVKIKDIGGLGGKEPERYLEENGPFILTMDVRKEFLFYKEGIFDGDMKKASNHGVLVVGHGYDRERDAKYWIVKNSWGKRWGEDGYFRLLNAHNMVGRKVRYYGFIRENALGITLE